MPDDLIEQLERRFDELERNIPDSMMSRRQSIRVLAAECLRQMEWARHRALEHVVGARMDAPRWAYETKTQIEDEPLTLAPPEWKP